MQALSGNSCHILTYSLHFNRHQRLWCWCSTSILRKLYSLSKRTWHCPSIKKAMRSSYKIEQKTRTNILYLQSDASRMNLRSTSSKFVLVAGMSCVVVHKSCMQRKDNIRIICVCGSPEKQWRKREISNRPAEFTEGIFLRSSTFTRRNGSQHSNKTNISVYGCDNGLYIDRSYKEKKTHRQHNNIHLLLTVCGCSLFSVFKHFWNRETWRLVYNSWVLLNSYGCYLAVRLDCVQLMRKLHWTRTADSGQFP